MSSAFRSSYPKLVPGTSKAVGNVTREGASKVVNDMLTAIKPDLTVLSELKDTPLDRTSIRDTFEIR
jgi:hypothetical protein